MLAVVQNLLCSLVRCRIALRSLARPGTTLPDSISSGSAPDCSAVFLHSFPLSVQGPSKEFCVVLDIDGTLARAALELAGTPSGGDLVLSGVPYQLANGAVEFLAYLLSLPNTEVAFFSAGEASRNAKLVSALCARLPAALRPAWWLSPRIVSGTGPSGASGGRKDLRLIRSGAALENTVLVDDHDTALEPQRASLLLLAEGFGCGPTATRAEALQRAQAEHNLLRAAALIDSALDRCRCRSRGGAPGAGAPLPVETGRNGRSSSLTRELSALLGNPEGTHTEELYRRGWALLSAFSPGVRQRTGQLSGVTLGSVVVAEGHSAAGRRDASGVDSAVVVFPWSNESTTADCL